jgi:serine phosphatase RsbU (regulator of sigma subunit)
MRLEPGKEHRERRDVGAREKNHDLIARLRREAMIRDAELEVLRARLDVAEHELEDLRAIRDALTPFELPQRPGLDLAAAFVPAAERVSGDFYLVAAGPQDSTLLLVGDVVGHGLHPPSARPSSAPRWRRRRRSQMIRASSWAGPTPPWWSGRVPATTSSRPPA